jgi:hypothetical protein
VLEEDAAANGAPLKLAHKGRMRGSPEAIPWFWTPASEVIVENI